MGLEVRWPRDGAMQAVPPPEFGSRIRIVEDRDEVEDVAAPSFELAR